MTSFEDWISKQDDSLRSNSNSAKAARESWNAALRQMEEALETDENLGDIKDTIKYLKTDA